MKLFYSRYRRGASFRAFMYMLHTWAEQFFAFVWNVIILIFLISLFAVTFHLIDTI